MKYVIIDERGMIVWTGDSETSCVAHWAAGQYWGRGVTILAAIEYAFRYLREVAA